MKSTLLALAAGLTFVAASAHSSSAQPYPQGGGNAVQYGGQSGEPPSDRDASSQWRQERRRGYAQNERSENGPPGPGPGGLPQPPRHPPQPAGADAAHFVFQRGPARVDITCPQVFALQDCIQAASELLDKIHSLRNGEARPGTGGSPSGASPPSPLGSGPNPQRIPGPVPQLGAPNPGVDNRM